MANPTFPTTLPQYVLESGYSETLEPQTVESQMDTGPAKVRRRFTKSIQKFSVQMLLTPAQTDTFLAFWQTTCLGGSIPFDWVHPRTRTALTMRFRNPPPTISTTGGGTANAVSFTLEAL